MKARLLIAKLERFLLLFRYIWPVLFTTQQRRLLGENSAGIIRVANDRAKQLLVLYVYGRRSRIIPLVLVVVSERRLYSDCGSRSLRAAVRASATKKMSRSSAGRIIIPQRNAMRRQKKIDPDPDLDAQI